MAEIETVPCRQRIRKGREQIIPKRPLNLREGDRTQLVRGDGRISITIYRASKWQRFWIRHRPAFLASKDEVQVEMPNA